MNLYNVIVYDHEGVVYAIPPKITRIQFYQRLSSPWNHQITTEMSADDPDAEVYRNLKDDYFVHIYRTDRYTGLTERVYEGLHVTLVDQQKANGDLIFNMYGSGYTILLNRRVVVPPAGLDNLEYTGAGETIMKQFVASQMITPEDSTRKMKNFTVEFDSGMGETITYNARYTNLMTVLENIAKQSEIDFGVVSGDTLNSFVFKTRSLWGTDRRVGADNEVVFSTQLGNMDIPIFSKNSSEEKNYLFVGGENHGAARSIVEMGDDIAINKSPWARKEHFIDGRQQTDESGLRSLGATELFEKRSIETLSFQVLQTPYSRWLTHWRLGDLVTARYFGFDIDKQITELNIIVTSDPSAIQPETVDVELEDFVER